VSSDECRAKADTGLICSTSNTLSLSSALLYSEGLADWVSVAGRVFEYLAMLRAEGPQEWVYEEMRRIAEIDFEFQDEEEESDFVERVCVEMDPLRARDRQDLLTAPVMSVFLHFIPSCPVPSCLVLSCPALPELHRACLTYSPAVSLTLALSPLRSLPSAPVVPLLVLGPLFGGIESRPHGPCIMPI
jgi:hypothetical protein